jgi:hypothetical protein
MKIIKSESNSILIRILKTVKKITKVNRKKKRMQILRVLRHGFSGDKTI